MAFRKDLRLVVAPPGETEGVVLSDLDMEFEVVRSTKVSENTAEFTIYGANESTRNDILIKDAGLEFHAGYKDSGGAGLIFRGNVIEAAPEKLPETWKVVIEASNVKRGKLNSTQVVLTYAPDSPLSQVVEDLAALFSMVVYGLANIDGITLPNGLAECTTARNALNYVEEILKFKGKGIYRDNDEIVIFNQGEASFFDIVDMSYDAGLIKLSKYEENEEKKKSLTGSSARDKTLQVEFSTLLFPQIRPNGIIKFSGVSDLLDGNYAPTIVKYVGDNRNGAFNCIGRADKL